MTTEQPERERMTDEQMDEVVSNLREIPVFGPIDTEDRDAAINLINQLRTQLTLAEQQRERMTEKQIAYAVDHFRKCANNTPIIKTAMEYFAIADALTQLRADLAAMTERAEECTND